MFVSIGSLEKYLYDALCIDSFLAEGKEVVFLDLSHWLFGEERTQRYDFVQSIGSGKDFEKAIREHLDDQTYFNIQIHYEDRFFTLFRLLKKFNCHLCRFEIGYLPEVSVANRAKNYITQPMDMLRRIKEKTLSFLARKLGLVKIDFDFIFYAGNVALEVASKKTHKAIAINYVDYEYYRQHAFGEKKSTRAEHKYIVFLDAYLAHHEDIKYNSTLKRLNSNEYINALNSFFRLLEKDLGLEVVIAIHPKANYAPDTFGNRKLVKNKTAELVFHSSLVISHHSTSISYAILGNKPIMLIYTSQMQEIYGLNIMPFMQVLSDEIKVPFINMDLVEELSIPDVSKMAYSEYKYKYLTSIESENRTNDEIITSFLKED